jgi:hypothetical protein
MQRRLLTRGVEGVAQGLAIDGNDCRGSAGACPGLLALLLFLVLHACSQCLHPGGEGVGKGVRVKPGEDAAEGVGAGNAVWQGQALFEPVFFGVCEDNDVVPAFGPAHDGADGDHEDVGEVVQAGSRDARVGQLCQAVGQSKGGRRSRRHGGFLQKESLERQDALAYLTKP